MNMCALRDESGDMSGRWFDMDLATEIGRDGREVLYLTRRGSLALFDGDTNNPYYFELKIQAAAVWCVKAGLARDTLPDELVEVVNSLEA